ncbi:heat shock protein HSP42 LALA0_S03e03532g [Lachancea lanzarotensis]|uniref:LALA0S03e03532g1_1 n=1 Tax=Lachancea lanzarotensis TaxID=1245769 RepID=A0A0C7MVA1_9SACH|nr:uncharacterized protein LALA0_S03e03532g [Lachancea lanzarotensis]CEP61468.1 LALA0S03e03532g1_1 [Lachancea lanzarotensis]
MSFYQPSLSLYDIVDALANQAAVRNQDRPDVRRVNHPRGHQGHHGHHHGGARHRAAVTNPYGQSYGQSPYYYVERPQTSYYRPSYYEEDDEEGPYYWTGLIPQQGPHQGPQQETQQRSFDFLPEILRAFTGSADVEQQPPRGADEKEAGQEMGEISETAPPVAEDPASIVQELKRAVESNDAEEIAAEEESARSEAPSPVPEPLQVSKPQTRRGAPFSPQVNVYDESDTYAVVMALPGASSKSFKIDYHPSSHELLIKGTLDKKFGFDDKNVRVSELHTGKFERSVKFPVVPRIKDEEIKASYSNGLLLIRIPKILDESLQHPPRRHIVIEDVPDEELEFEKNPNPQTSL